VQLFESRRNFSCAFVVVSNEMYFWTDALLRSDESAFQSANKSSPRNEQIFTSTIRFMLRTLLHI
jgi:hypothetical protein